jgi:hypothetical protein
MFLRRISRCFKEIRRPRTEPKIVTLTTSKAIIDSLVTNVVAKQLDMPSLMHDDIQEADEEPDEEGSKEVDAADDWEQDNEEAVNAEPMASQEPKKSLCQPFQLELTKPSKISTLTKSQTLGPFPHYRHPHEPASRQRRSSRSPKTASPSDRCPAEDLW